jgi:hypothetical protein
LIVDRTNENEVSLPPGTELRSIAECAGEIYGTFYVQDRRKGALGSFKDGRWAFDEIGDNDASSVGFDEGCRPFVAGERLVWSKGKHGWVSSGGFTSGEIKGIVAHEGTVYAVYEEVHDGVSVGIASAPLVAEPN